MNKKEENSLLHLQMVEGELRSEHNKSSVRCAITIGRQGGIALAFEPLDLNSTTAWLSDVAFAKGVFIERLSIRGTTPDGILLESDDVYLLSHQITSDTSGTRLILDGEASRMRFTYRPLRETSFGAHVTYLTVGMRAFGESSVETELGKVSLTGPTTIEDPDNVCGRVHIRASGEPRPLTEWLSGCDRLVSRILDIVSFAEGRLIRWSVRQIESEHDVFAIDCEGPKGTGPAVDGVFHYLNLQPVLDLAVSRYTEELCEKTGVAIALEWFVHHPRYAELQLVAAMTALEHLVAVFAQNYGVPTIVSSELFTKLRESTSAVWRDLAPGTDQTGIERLIGKLGSFNEGSFRDKLGAMLTVYKVPLGGLGLERITGAVVARNKIVHRGHYRSESEREGLQQHVAVLRELLKRIFLMLLQYEGEYLSLLNGPQWVLFPPSDDAP